MGVSIGGKHCSKVVIVTLNLSKSVKVLKTLTNRKSENILVFR